MSRLDWTGIHFLEKTTYSKPYKKNDAVSVIVWICLAAVCFAVFECSIFSLIFDGLAFDYERRHIYAVIAAASFLAAALSLYSKFLWTGILIYAVGMSLFSWIIRDVLKNGFESIFFRIQDLWDAYISGRSGLEYWSGRLQPQVYIWAALLLCFWGIIFAFGIKKVFFAWLPGIAALAVIFFTGNTPSVRSMVVFLLSGCLLFVCMYGRSRYGRYSMLDMFGKNLYIRAMLKPLSAIGAKSALLMACLLGLCVLGALGYKQMVGLPDEQTLKDYKKHVQAWYEENTDLLDVDAITKEKEGKAAKGGMSEGNLAAAGDLYYHGDEQLLVTVEKWPSSSVYVKGYVGDLYENNQWKQSAHADFDQFDVTSADLLCNMPYYLMSGDGCYEMTIEKKADFGDLMFMPYGARIDEALWQGDGYIRGDISKTSYICSSSFYDMMRNIDTLAVLGMSSMLYDGEQPLDMGEALLSEIRGGYRAYVYEHYTAVPDDLRAVLADFRKNASFEQLNEAIVYVRQLLNQNCTYSLTPGILPAGKDFTEYFLTQNRIGYCMHFATAATLLLRDMGIPARYAEGYVLAPGAFKIGDTGAYATVYDHQAHAWTEVYIDGFGWVPVEMTPSYYDENALNGLPENIGQSESSLPELESETQMVTSSGSSETADSDETAGADGGGETAGTDGGGETTGADVGEDQESHPQDMGGEEVPLTDGHTNDFGAALQKVLANILKVLLVLLVILLLLGARYCYVNYRRRQRQALVNNTHGVVAMYDGLAELFAALGVKRNQSADMNAYVQQLSARFDCVNEVQMQQFVGLVHRCAFGPGQISRQQWQEAAHYCQQLRQSLLKRQGLLKRLYLIYIRCV